MTWIDVGAVDDVPADEGLRVEHPELPEPVALFRMGGSVTAIGDTCSHGQASLAEGWVEGATVECPFHLARFDICTGAALCLPATVGVSVFPVRERDGRVLLKIE